jgi:hypothetical protein
VIALDLALGHRVIRLAAGVRHAMLRCSPSAQGGQIEVIEEERTFGSS